MIIVMFIVIFVTMFLLLLRVLIRLLYLLLLPLLLLLVLSLPFAVSCSIVHSLCIINLYSCSTQSPAYASPELINRKKCVFGDGYAYLLKNTLIWLKCFQRNSAV